jgi:hypothetical protein
LKEKLEASGYKTEINDRGNLLCSPRDTLYQQKLALTSPTSGGRSVGIVRTRTKVSSSGCVASNGAVIVNDELERIWKEATMV